jgi:hypothetical protein
VVHYAILAILLRFQPRAVRKLRPGRLYAEGDVPSTEFAEESKEGYLP